ncbi:CHRD domain-containing protein [soil metagenome]
MSRRRFSPIVATLLASMLAIAAVGAVSAGHFQTFSTTLNGAEEVPGPGDPNGKGKITLDVYLTGTICYTAKTQAIAGVGAAHIHEAPAGEAGPVVVDLRPDLADRKGNKRSYCVSTTPDIAADIIANPTDYYVNVHNAEYPMGAIRGQLGD